MALFGSKQLGLGRVPCVRIEHLSETEQRVLRLAVNRLGEKGEWNLDELKIEFEELIFADAPVKVSGFALDEIDHIVLGEGDEAIEEGPLAPEAGAIAVARVGDVFNLGPHRIICGSSIDPETLRRLTAGNPPERLVPTDEPYNVPIAGHVTGGRHREFAMASGEMTDAEFLAFNEAWMAAVLPCLRDGGVFGSFIDWRGYPTVHSAAIKLGRKPINLVVWTKTNAGMGSLYRSQHELLPLFKNGSAPHVNNIELGKRGRWRSNVWTYPAPPRSTRTHDVGLRTTRLSNRRRCSKMPFWTLPTGATSSSTPSWVPARRLWQLTRPAGPVAASAANLVETGETFQALTARRGREAAGPAPELPAR